ncbi:DNA primase [Schaalia sp. 19OD2882]|uniref:DNA primase n=1 Tax=Schaalia sp. 19OD2882 TaxID=2794089 RepID=UPI001C1EBFFB|nr:DNA primase [Schaalia sp. 19OD2882]QWW18998.1 DNA primase [Schaalia sp. 19OD2882]
MAGRIREEDVRAVKDAVRIEEIVGEHVTLRTAGVGSLKGLCPFHDERTPSFHVRPAVGMWHCFGCGQGGDVIAFVREINHMGFSEAVEMLAQKAGVTLHYEDGGRPVRTEEPGRRQRLLDAHRAAEEFYQGQLNSPEAHVGRTFLAQRGFNEAMCRHFGVGYAPKSWDSLTRHLRSRGFTDQELVTGGLASQGNRGIYDRFRGRLVWPIRDVSGATVGFGARRLDDSEDSPKYLNTPETPIYKKSQVLYGLDLARKEISRGRRVVIVEGYTDVMAAHVADVRCAVATCGTAFGPDHVRIVRRLLGDSADPAAGVVLTDGRAHGGEVIFTFDGDAAGQKAALRAFSEDQNFAAQTFVAVESSGMDPCELRMARGNEAVKELVSSRIPLFEFVIRSVLARVDLRTAEGRVSALRSGAPVVAGIKDRALRSEYSRSLAGWLGMDVTEVNRAVRQASATSRHRQDSAPEPGRPAMAGAGRPAPRERRGPEDPVSRVERQALEALLQRPMDLIGSGFEELDGSSFTVPTHRAVHDAIRAAGGLALFQDLLGQEETREGVGERAVLMATRRFVESVRDFAGPVVGDAVSQMVVAPLDQDREEQMRDYCRGLMAAMVRMDLTRRTGEARAALQRLSEEDPAHAQAFAELMRLEQRRQRFTIHDQ